LGLVDKWNDECGWRCRNPDNLHHGRGPGQDFPTIKINDGKGDYHLRQNGTWQNDVPNNASKYLKFFGPNGKNWLNSKTGEGGFANPVILYLLLLILAIPVVNYVNDHLPSWQWPVFDPQPKDMPTSCPADMGKVIIA
jgi:hypothetical protein